VAPLDQHFSGTVDLLALSLLHGPAPTCTAALFLVVVLYMQLVAPLDQHSSGTVDLLALSPLHGLAPTCPAALLLPYCCSS
jgi:hypothetical protein